jgi:hypothetical protein
MTMFTAVVLVCMSAGSDFCGQVTMIRSFQDAKVVVPYQTQKECLDDAQHLAGMIAQSFDGQVTVSFQCVQWGVGS